MEDNIDCGSNDTVVDTKENRFISWLANASLEKYHQQFLRNGITEISHIEDIQEEDAESLGLSKFEFRRLVRLYADFKTQTVRDKENVHQIPKAVFKTSSSSLVLTLPKVMQDYVQTRDGLGNVVVRTESLKRHFRNLYYESPLNPSQVFSNYFILKMAGERLKFAKSLRECELWCRKERSKRICVLLGIAKSPTIDNWSSYYKKQSAYGILEITKLRYPEVVALKESNSQPGIKHYQNVCKFFEGCQDSLELANTNVKKCQNEIEKTLRESKNGEKRIQEGLEEQNKFYNDLLPQVQSVSKDVKEVVNTYESLVDQCRTKFGSSVSEQLCQRKKKRNLQKERRKAKKHKSASPMSKEKGMPLSTITEDQESIADGE